jgi:hypothetical protein
MTSRQMAHGAPSPAAGGSASTAAREAAPLPPPAVLRRRSRPQPTRRPRSGGTCRPRRRR